MAIKYVFAKDAAELSRIQKRAVNSVNKARDMVQIAAVATIKHAYDHGDWTFAQTLVDGLGNTINGQALVEWFVQFGGLKVEDGKGFSGWSGKEHIKEHFEAAKATMWWDLKKKNPYKGFDLEQALKNVLAQHAKAMKMVEANPDDADKIQVHVNDATIKQVLALCNFEAMIEGVEEQDQQAA